MREVFVVVCLSAVAWSLQAQPVGEPNELMLVKKVEHTPVKDQAGTSTCWSFAATSLVEAQAMKGPGLLDISEMFTVRNVYMEKARNYLLRQGKARFSPGGLGHDVIHAIETYGAIPEHVYSGLLLGKNSHNHDELDENLKTYLDNILKTGSIPNDWIKTFEAILDEHLGKVPASFTYREKTYTPKSFATEVLKFNANDYVYLTSFSHHPFYTSFIPEVPDNYSNGSYFNLPLEELIQVVTRSLEKGYSVVWDGDVSNNNFRQRKGFVLQWKNVSKESVSNPDAEEESYDQQVRQQLFENLTTQDDHLMHLVGLERSKNGKIFFLTKDSYGNRGPFKGYLKMSEAYFAINTVTIVVPKAALEDTLRSRVEFRN